MANSIQLNQGTVFAGLGTSSFTVVAPGLYSVSVQSTIPHDAGSSLNSAQAATSPFASALQIVINLNGSPVVTVGGSAANPTPNQPFISAAAHMSCVATDVISVVLSSANAIDAQPNTVKSIINLFQGE